MTKIITALAAGLSVLQFVWGQESNWPLERYRNIEFPPTVENLGKGWQDRVALEYDIINKADLESLRAALDDENPFVRAMAARALGILEDKDSADALAELVESDPEYLVRIRAVESLSLLKMKPEVIELAKKDPDAGVSWTVALLAGQLESETNYAAQIREAYAKGISRDEMGSAQVGLPAPDFSATTSDGKPFKLSDVLGQEPIAIYFAAFDG